MSLLVVGALHWDVVVRAPRLPRLDETLRGSSVQYRLGGKGGNQAIAAAGAGANVTFAGRIGSDASGAAMRADLAAAGIDLSALQQGPGASGMSAAIVEEGGAYGAVIVSGENFEFDPEALAIPMGCRMLLLQNEMAPGLNAQVAAKARATGADVVLNAAPALGIDQRDLSLVDTLIVNRIEGADLAQIYEDDPSKRVFDALQSLAPDATILLTLGADGVCFAVPGGAMEHQPAKAVDVHSTHGAGDVFVGTYAAERLRGVSLGEAVAAGQAAAARQIAQTS